MTLRPSLTPICTPHENAEHEPKNRFIDGRIVGRASAAFVIRLGMHYAVHSRQRCVCRRAADNSADYEPTLMPSILRSSIKQTCREL